MISVDDRQLRQFAKELKIQRPSQQAAIVRGVLNDQARATRARAKTATLPRWYIIRRANFLASSLRITWAKGRDTTSMQSIMGARETWGKRSSPFIGLKEQEEGGEIRGYSIPTAFSRGGDFSKSVKRKYRFDALGEIVRIMPGRELWHIRRLDKANYKGAFRITKSTHNLKAGVYVFFGRRVGRGRNKIRPIKMIKDESRKNIRISRVEWMRPAVEGQRPSFIKPILTS